jgi:hypothetical protein
MAAGKSQNWKPGYAIDTHIVPFLFRSSSLSIFLAPAHSIKQKDTNAIISFLFPSELSACGPISYPLTEYFLGRLKFWQSTEM